MFGWVSSIARTATAPVMYLGRTLLPHKEAAQAAANPGELSLLDGSAVTQRLSGSTNAHTLAGARQICGEEPVPEWKTDAWKARVEGDARRQFDDEIAGVGQR